MPPMPSCLRRAPGLASALVAASLLMATPLPAVANDNADIAELKRQIEESRRLIEALSAKVSQLEAANQQKQAQPDSGARIAALQDEVSQLESTVSRRSADSGVPLHGFADVGAALRSQGLPKGAKLGQLDFYLNPQISQHVKSLVELNFEVGDERNAAVGVDLERMQLGYVFSDALTLWAGRFHTPYGYWNTAYHHGAQIQTSVLRPRFLDFEDAGGILPAHSVGLWAVGSQALSSGDRIGYDFYVANGPNLGECGSTGGCVLNPNLGTDDNHSLALGGRVHYDFGSALEGLQLGTHWLRAQVDDGLSPADRSRLNVYGGYVVEERDDWQLLGEFYLFRNETLAPTGGTHTSRAGYLQLSRSFGDWTPYLRGEKTSLDQTDVYFAAMQSGVSYERGLVGLRYELTPAAALKLELNRSRDTDRDRTAYSEARVQFAVRF